MLAPTDVLIIFSIIFTIVLLLAVLNSKMCKKCGSFSTITITTIEPTTNFGKLHTQKRIRQCQKCKHEIVLTSYTAFPGEDGF